MNKKDRARETYDNLTRKPPYRYMSAKDVAINDFAKQFILGIGKYVMITLFICILIITILYVITNK